MYWNAIRDYILFNFKTNKLWQYSFNVVLRLLVGMFNNRNVINNNNESNNQTDHIFNEMKSIKEV